MKSRLLTIVLATLTVGLLGSCSKINERIDGLDRRTYNLENNQIASVNQQVAAIKASIADLETIRTDLKTVMDAKAAQGEDIKDLKTADEVLEGKIDELNTYVDTELAKYATTEWANATFATLEKQAEIITDVTKLKTDIAGFDATLDEAIANLDTSLKSWVNEQLSAYYTAAQMDAKVKALQDEIDALKTAGETDETKIEGLETKLTQVAQDLAAAKESIKTAYEKAIKDAIEGNDGYITETIKNAIADVNGKITDITGRVDTLDTTVGVLTGRIDAIEAMIQTVTIVPVYDDGSVKAANGVLELNLIVSPAGAVKGLTKENVNILVNTVLTKAVSVDTVKTENISSFIVDEANGTVEIKADINENLPSEEWQALTVAVNVKNGISDYTTEFVPVTAIVITPYVEIAAKYDGRTVSTLRWYKQSLAITDSGKKAWTGGSGSAVKVPGTDEDVVVGDFFPWGAFAGFYGGGADSDKGLLPYTGFTNKGCGDASDSFTFKTDKQFDAANSPYYSGSVYTKYNGGDGKTSLDASDDAASIILGNTWRIPTSTEFQAMKEATYWAWDATDNGYYVYTPNPASDAGKVNDGAGKYNKSRALLFYPAAGYGNTTVLTSAYGYYQSSTLGSISPDYADYMNFSDNSVNPENSNYRFIGMSIRPVQDPAAEYVAVTEVKFDVTAKEVEAGGNAQLNVVVTPSTATQPGVYWKSSDETVATVDATGKVKGVGEGTATITATTVDGGKTATCTVTVIPAKPYVEIAAKYDGSTTTTLRWYRQNLAITNSGKKAWKGNNTGDNPEVKVPVTNENVIVGDYFPWGTFAGFYGGGDGSDKGLLPYDSFTNTGCGDASVGFTFKSGKQFNQANDPYWSGSAYTKYNTTDKKTTLDVSDDVASIILGGTWRMPTSAEFQAMKETTYWAWDETDKGYYVYAPASGDEGGLNGKKADNSTPVTGSYNKGDALLFFPAAGCGNFSSIAQAGVFGRYWSSSLYSSNSSYAYFSILNSNSVNPNSNNGGRYNGFSVRPVQDPAAKYVAVTEIKLDANAKEVELDGNVQLNAMVTPSTATQPGVYWKSSNPSVATVDAIGKVKGVKVGTATITATTVDGSKTATCTVTVKRQTKTMAEILATTTDISESTNLTPPTNTWINSTDPTCKAFIGKDGEAKLFVILKPGSTSSLGMSMTDTFEKYDDNTYKKVITGVGTLTVKMTEGKFTSYEFASASGSAYKALNGVYAAWVSVTFVNPEGDVISTMPATQYILKGSKASKPSNPTDKTTGSSGFHTFEGWYKTKNPTSGELSDKWDFNNVVTEDITLYAQWQTTIEKILSKAADAFPYYDKNETDINNLTKLSDVKSAIAAKGEEMWTATTEQGKGCLYKGKLNNSNYIIFRAPREQSGKERIESTSCSRQCLKTGEKYKAEGTWAFFTFTIVSNVFTQVVFLAKEGTTSYSQTKYCDGTYTPQ